jgi:ABC-type lipoprotein export system ATPase subunit
MKQDLALKLTDVSRTYEFGTLSVPMVEHVDLAVVAGEIVSVRGLDGSGRTVLLNMVAGLCVPSRGKIEVCGVDISSDRGMIDELRKGKVAFLSRVSSLVPDMTVYENIELALRAKAPGSGKTTEEIYSEIDLAGKDNRRVADLSKLDTLRLSIGRSLASNPDLFICDDPMEQLDQDDAETMIEFLFQKSRDTGTAVVIGTEAGFAAEMADRSFEMDEGRLVQLGGEGVG